MHVRRVGSITCGVSLIIYGILFLISTFYQPFDYSFVLRFWPIILIGMGIEMLAAVHQYRQDENCALKYDKGAVFILILLMFFACGMGIADYCLRYMEMHTAWYY